MFDFIKYKDIIYLTAFCVAGFQSTSVSAGNGGLGGGEKSPEIVRILSIDGGVVRGIIPATILADIEKKTEKPIAELFHVVGGTSVGCVLTAGLTVPKEGSKTPRLKAQEAINLFYKDCPNIFRRRLPIGSIYDTVALEKMVDDNCGRTTFDQSIIPTVAVTFDILAGKTKPFCSWDKK